MNIIKTKQNSVFRTFAIATALKPHKEHIFHTFNSHTLTITFLLIGYVMCHFSKSKMFAAVFL